MTKPEISAELRDALIAAANTNTIDGPRGRAIAVIRVAIDRRVKYVGGARHVIVINDRPVMVCQAVDIANAVLERAGLLDQRIDYPGAKFQSSYITGANDNTARHITRADMGGGVA
ncbi:MULTISPECIES: hypothetical protein [unclassified Thalassospira]|uniref:hypothetical protein n=1 Tax=unclassified Thalassospira TaxID=2648997 RepID=UPI0007A5A355|nr:MULTISPECIES: hypothetical protein [unclassified Thalassospira]KZC99714.1 hypothetical protein AUQ41_08540 [Thalassospira sp. MCCC 1A02898]ONH85356.1 hypothetical protein TH47_05795 [Thalassospira sp. MCCC 1A02803]